ncbi:O-antigen ligase family protein [Heyndrickxia sporothermodurans]|nr:O-antigen ligase family protein [Heyndrickxia sporothermodurans]
MVKIKRVEYSLDHTINTKTPSMLFMLAIVVMSLLLNQSGVVFGVNISFADIFCLGIFLSVLYKKELYIPIIPSLFYLIVSAVVLFTAVIYVPIKFEISPGPIRIISDYIKLIAIFVYFIVGYNLSKLGFTQTIIKWYSIFGVFLGGLGVLFTVFHLSIFSNLLYFAGTRYKGLMIDPNYFSVLNISALAYVSRIKAIKNRYKIFIIFITFLSVLSAGSKTGMITFFCYFVLRIIEYLFLTKKKMFSVILQLLFITFFILFIPIFISKFSEVISYLSVHFPSFSRVEYLFTDFGSAISESGSGRDDTWKVAIQIIQLSPLIGVGIGTYTDIAYEMFQYNNVAHNTFLQLSAEWGLPLAFFFFSYLLFTIGKVTFSNKQSSPRNLILRDIIVVLLIGSVSISLNNARVLWIFLGAMLFSLDGKKMKAET